MKGDIMRHAINRINHIVGTIIFIIGILMLFKAAGLADLGGDFADLVHTSLASVAAVCVGAFVIWWKV